MLSPTEKTLLKELLSLVPVPEDTLSFNELMGFMYGLAITPVKLPEAEWMAAIFGNDEYDDSVYHARSLANALRLVYASFLAEKEKGDLHFPYHLETLQENQLQEVLEWASGFEESLALCPEIWEPVDDAEDDKKQEELFFSMMVIQGLVDPLEIMPFFEKLPNEILAEAFTSFDDTENRDLQIQAFLLATLPLAVQTLQNHALAIELTMPAQDRPRFSFTAEQPATASTSRQAKNRSASNVIKVDFARKSRILQEEQRVPSYQLKVSLRKAKPPIWRRVRVPGTATLADLHEIIQTCMGWFDNHLHQFEINGTLYGPVLENEPEVTENRNEARYTLHSLALKNNSQFDYIYDFGDHWEHRISVEEVLAPEEGVVFPELLTGRRACPPEDIGGIYSYLEFLKAYTDPSHQDHEAMLDWAGDDFQPDIFDKDDIDDINATLQELFPKQ